MLSIVFAPRFNGRKIKQFFVYIVKKIPAGQRPTRKWILILYYIIIVLFYKVKQKSNWSLYSNIKKLIYKHPIKTNLTLYSNIRILGYKVQSSRNPDFMGFITVQEYFLHSLNMKWCLLLWCLNDWQTILQPVQCHLLL